MNLKQFFKETFEPKNPYLTRQRIICKDGFSLSIQGSSYHYCEPRETAEWFKSVEIGYPSHEEPDIAIYAEEPNELTNTVYGYVPVSIAQSVIDKHGGIDIAKTFNQ